MTTPIEEDVARAREIVFGTPTITGLVDGIAIALAETREAELERCAEWKSRAEAAERERDVASFGRDSWRTRAEAAEKAKIELAEYLDKVVAVSADALRRAEAAEKALADFKREPNTNPKSRLVDPSE